MELRGGTAPNVTQTDTLMALARYLHARGYTIVSLDDANELATLRMIEAAEGNG